MDHLLKLWYVSSPNSAWQFYLRIVGELEGSVGVRDMLRNIRQPLFQDYTWQGRLIGLIMRLARISFGLILYFLMAILGAVIFLIWLLFPFLCVAAILGSFIGNP